MTKKTILVKTVLCNIKNQGNTSGLLRQELGVSKNRHVLSKTGALKVLSHSRENAAWPDVHLQFIKLGFPE